MQRIFGRNWVAKRGRAAKARGAIDERTSVASGLTVPTIKELQIRSINQANTENT